MKKKISTLLLSVIMVFTVFTGTTIGASSDFKDVPEGTWYRDSLDYIINDSRDIISGYPDGTFRPSGTLTVEQFVKCVIEAGDFEIQPVESGSWSAPYIQKAKEKGYMYNSEFDDVTRSITRGEMARIIIRSVKDITGEVNFRDIEKIIPLISDYEKIETQLQEYVVKCYDAGIILGYPDGTFKADNNLTRAEAISVLRKLIDVSKRQVPEVSTGEEEITFDPEEDTTERGAMEIDKQEEYVTKFFKSIKLYEEDGKSYVKGYLPEVPDGFRWYAALGINYKNESRDYFYAGGNGTRTDIRFYTNEPFNFELIGGKEDFDNIAVSAWVENDEGIESARFFLNYKEDFYIKYDKFEEHIYDYNWEGIFEW